VIFHEGVYPFAENKSQECREAQNCERPGNIYVEGDFENLLNSYHSQPDPTVLIENSGDKAHGSPLRRDQFNRGPGQVMSAISLGLEMGLILQQLMMGLMMAPIVGMNMGLGQRLIWTNPADVLG